MADEIYSYLFAKNFYGSFSKGVYEFSQNRVERSEINGQCLDCKNVIVSWCG